MPATQITSFVADVTSGKPPFPTVFRGLLSVVSPFAGLAGKTVSIQIFANEVWNDTGVTTITDNNGVFYTTIVWDPALMLPGSYRIRAYFAGDGTYTPSGSGEVTVTMTSGGMDWIIIGVAAVGLLAVVLLVRRRK